MAIDFSKLMKKKQGGAPAVGAGPAGGAPPMDMVEQPQGAMPGLGALMGGPAAAPKHKVKPPKRGKSKKY